MVMSVEPPRTSPDYTVKEAAAYLRLSTKTIYGLIKSGVLPASTVTRKKMIPRLSVEKLHDIPVRI